MAKKKLIEDQNIQDKESSPIERDDSLYKKKIVPTPKPEVKIGLDTDREFYDTLVRAAESNKLDVSKLESFTQISQNRNQVYGLIDTMAEDSTIAAVLETYVEDATETNMDGRIVWAESDDPKIAKYATYLLDTMNVDKNAYKWMYSLTKYGDLYLRLYRESEYNDKLFDTDNEEEINKHNQSKIINESLARVMEGEYDTPNIVNQEISRAEAERLDDLDEEFAAKRDPNSMLNEDVNVKIFSKNDRYVHYLEMIPNPAEMYELIRLGKSYAYIQAPNAVSLNKKNEPLNAWSTAQYSYAFKKKDVNLYEATEFVHAALEDNSARVPEEVNIFLDDNAYESGATPLTYTVRRGQSLLYNSFKIWREMMLLEYSLLLNRVTKSSIVRIIGVEVGDMPKEQIGPHLAGIKALFEQKSALDVGSSMSEYTNPGPIENNIYVPTHNNIGVINPQQVGGDANVTGLEDLNYFKDKLFGSLKVPKQYFGFTDDSAGFDGGTSLSIISSRYAKTVKRLQNTFIQAITDAINLMLIDKGLTSYINKFELHMVSPTTREDLDRQDNVSSKVGLVNDIMMLVSGDIKDIESRLEILKALLDDAVSDPTVAEVIQKEIDKYDEMKRQGIQLDEDGNPIIEEDMTGLTGDVGGGGDFSGGFDAGGDLGGDDFSGGGDDFSGADTSSDLPSPDSLGVDFTDSENF